MTIRQAKSLINRILAGFLLLIFSASAVFAQEPVSFAVIGDSGEINTPQRNIARQMKVYRDTRGRFEFVLMLGDNVYPDGVGQGLDRHFETPYRALLDAGVRFHAVLGNHDIRAGTQDQITYDKFNMNNRRFYNFVKRSGMVEFFALDSTPLSEEAEELAARQLVLLERQKAITERQKARNERVGVRAATIERQEELIETLDARIKRQQAFLAEQRAVREAQIPWLRSALQASTARWKVVFLHHSIYSSAREHGTDDGVLRLRRLLEPIFLETKVNVVFAGHDHVVEETKPQGPPGGHKVYYMTEGASARLRRGDLDTSTPFHEWGEDTKYSFLVVRVTEREMQIDVVDSEGNLLKPRPIQIPRLN